MAAERLAWFERIAKGVDTDVPFVKTLGMRLVTIGGGAARVDMDVDLPRLANPLGVLHGGATTSLADHAMGMAMLSILPDEETFGTVELKVNLIKAIRTPCKLVAAAKVLTAGRTIALVEVTVTRADDGALVARGVSTCLRVKAGAAA